METTIKITGIESKQASTGNTKIILIDGKTKYFFWQNKADGSDSIAHQEFKKMGLQVGDTVQAYVNVEDKEFTNSQGKLIKYQDRFITKFVSKAQNGSASKQNNEMVSTYQHAPKNGSDSQNESLREFMIKVNENFAKITAKLQELDKTVQGLRTLSVDVNGEPAVELHEELDQRPEDEKVKDHEDIPIVGDTDDIKLDELPI